MCAIEGCEQRIQAKGLCSMHYARQRTGVAMDAPKHTKSQPTGRIARYIDSLCSADGCPSPAKAKGMCRFHYQRRLAGVSFAKPLRGRGCRVEGCTKTKLVSLAEQLCWKHYPRFLKGQPFEPEKLPFAYAQARGLPPSWWGWLLGREDV